MKICCRCEKEKPLTRFFKNRRSKDGLTYHCADCANSWNRATYARDRERIQATNKKWRENNQDKHREAHNMATRKYEINNPKIRYAQVRVRESLKQRKLAKKGCEVCLKIYGIEAPAHAHHSDYNKPLELLWLCPKHHKAWHKVFIPEY